MSGQNRLQNCSTAQKTLSQTLQSEIGLSATLVSALWDHADEFMQSGQKIKLGNRCSVMQVEVEGTPWVVKRFNLRGPMHSAIHSFFPSRAQTGWDFGRLLIEAEVLTPKPVAWLQKKLGPLNFRSYLVTEYLAGQSLDEKLFDRTTRHEEKIQLAIQFSQLWNRLGQLRITHGDLKATNFIVTDDGGLWLIDLDSMTQHRNQSSFQKARKRDWQRFLKNWQSEPGLVQLFEQAVSGKSLVEPASFELKRSA